MTRALVLEAVRSLVAREFDRASAAADDGWLRVEACGLCGTDHEQFTGQLFGGFAFVPGHETVGVIDAIGPAASTRWRVGVGDRVAVEVFQRCGRCRECAIGAYNRCRTHGLRDMYGFVDIDRSPGLWGGYAEAQYLAPDSLLLAVPDALDSVTATLFNPVGAGIRWGVTLPATQPGSVVAVLGPGVRGLATCAASVAAGAATVMVTGAGSRDEPRLALARRFGADLTVDVEHDDPVAALRDSTGGRLADVVVDVTAKSPEAIAQAIALARPGGTIVVAGTRGTAVPEFLIDHVVYKELRILGALGVDTAAYQGAFALLADPQFPWSEIDRRVEPLDADRVSDLLLTMAGERGTPPMHAVVAPTNNDERKSTWMSV
jgi:alcohol dehydrogenase